MGVEYGRRVLRMELCADVPLQGRYLNNFHKVSIRIDSNALHASLLICLFVRIVELITVTMTLFDEF